ncbi:discoidin domain-containing protein, partial [Capnocytophaga canis]|uniref:discoidin domain-containing protein n=1 Tax=Capnocytophaga canis TaxID=1848903 RepID=UPI00156254DF
IDFDMNEVRNIKGFTYLPYDNWSSKIKEYSVSISSDGKNWTEIQKGTFDTSAELKRILFDKTLKTRYVRFTALSQHYNQDFASGAEFSVLEE